MKELKAVEILILMQRVDDVSTRQMQKEINEALAELLETQAKLESLREHCREQVDNINKISSIRYKTIIGDFDIIDVMKRTIYRDMLNKLEEEGKAQ